MLAVAQERISTQSTPETRSAAPKVDFARFDVLNDPIPANSVGADGVVSTLVLEHLPLDVFFSVTKKMLKSGGVLLLTNMHAGLGKKSRAGFLDAETGSKVQGTSFAYEIPEVMEMAESQGFKIIGRMGERGVEERDLEKIGGRGKKWVGVKVWFGGVFRLEG